MTTTAQYVAVGIFAGFAIVVTWALLVLFRRVAVLERPCSTHLEEIQSDETLEDEPIETSDAEEEVSTHVHFLQRHMEPRAQPEWKRPVTAPHQAGQFRDSESEPELTQVSKRKARPVSVDRAVQAYNELAADFSQAHLRGFEGRWHPEPVARTAGNRLADDPKGDFWLIRSEGPDEMSGLVVPGPEVVRNWELYYRSMESLAAKKLLTGLYEVGDNAPLRLDQPAIATKTEKGWRVETPGTFADV